MGTAFIFDLDGVLTDTAAYHYAAWRELAQSLGLRFGPAQNELLKGVSRRRSLDIILELNHAKTRYTEREKEILAQRKNDRYRKMLEALAPRDVLPGIPAFLRQARGCGIRLAVASASRNAGTVLRALGLTDQFDYVADAAQISRPKPDPEIFLTCAQHLGAAPADCVGFEDSQAGIEAIKAAGMFAVGIHVKVSTVCPDLALADVRELDVQKILRAQSGAQI